jgi:hypothetical protein
VRISRGAAGSFIDGYRIPFAKHGTGKNSQPVSAGQGKLSLTIHKIGIEGDLSVIVILQDDRPQIVFHGI